MSKITRWGILSTANIARIAMIPALKKSKMAKVAAVASRNLERARAFAEAQDVPQAYGSYQALLDDKAIDAVYIPLPNHLHKPWTIHAAKAGKHILCEKPLALTAAETREMIAAADANRVVLMESFMYRYHPRVLAARDMVRSGAIGDLKVIESAFTFRLRNQDNIRYDPAMGGGALMDVGCYCVNISRLMAGREPLSVQARASWAKSGVDEQLTAILDFGAGLTAHFDCALNLARRERCIVAGTEGYLSLPMVFLPGEDPTQLDLVKGRRTDQIQTFDSVNEYQLIAEDFMRSIQGEAPAFPITDSTANLRVIQALLESARQDGQPVKI